MRRVLILSACLAVFACSEDLVGPDAESGTTVVTLAALNGEEEAPHFFFLPPLVAGRTFDGVFNATRSPTVEICLVEADECPTTQPNDFPIVFTRDTGPGSERARARIERGDYAAKRHCGCVCLVPG